MKLAHPPGKSRKGKREDNPMHDWKVYRMFDGIANDMWYLSRNTDRRNCMVNFGEKSEIFFEIYTGNAIWNFWKGT